jgi:hypothetical protein
VAAMTPSSRDKVLSSSPRKSRSTASAFRWELNRPFPPRQVGAAPVGLRL